MRFILFFCIVYCQNLELVNIQNIYNINNSRQTKLLSLKNNRILKIHGFNQYNWFYYMGPYNDTWGSDIFKSPNNSVFYSQSYNPFGNPIFGIKSESKTIHPMKNPSIYLSFLGINVKNIKKLDGGNIFYGSE